MASTMRVQRPIRNILSCVREGTMRLWLCMSVSREGQAVHNEAEPLTGAIWYSLG